MPSGSQIIPHDLSKKAVGSGITISLGGITIQGNIIGNEQYADYIGNHIAGRIKLALANI